MVQERKKLHWKNISKTCKKSNTLQSIGIPNFSTKTPWSYLAFAWAQHGNCYEKAYRWSSQRQRSNWFRTMPILGGRIPIWRKMPGESIICHAAVNNWSETNIYHGLTENSQTARPVSHGEALGVVPPKRVKKILF